VNEPIGPLASTGYWLKRGALAWQRQLDIRLRPLGLTNSQFTVLAAVSWIGFQGGTPTQQDIADFAGTDRMMTSKLLQSLAARGLVERTADAQDARVRRITLTPAGRHLITESTAVARQVDAEFFGADRELRDRLRTIFDHDAPPG
jgi:DNA-binding MarR family transcriptional regulator